MYYFGHNTATRELFMTQLVEAPPPVIAVDIETVSLKERMPLGFAIAVSTDEAWYFQCYPDTDKEIELVRPLLNNAAVTKVFHYAMFDLRSFPLICPIDTSNIADTSVMARLLGRDNVALEWLAIEVNKQLTSAKDLMRKYAAKTMLQVPAEELAKHCADDARTTIALYHKYLPSIDASYFKVEMEVIPILIDMSLRGVRYSEADRAALEVQLEKDVAYYKGTCAEYGFSPGSNQQVGYMLAKRGNFLPFTKTRKQLRTDEETLQFVDDPLAAAVLGFRRANKLLTTYIRPLKGQGRIFTNYSLDVIVGRVSSSNMNMQNIPESIRYMLMPDSGWFANIDFSQEHLRILMHFSGDRQMRRVYNDGEMDGDIHSFTSREMFGSTDSSYRKIAKVLNYAIVYGATAKTISANAKIKDMRKCSGFLDSWFRIFKDAAEWIKEAQKYGLRTGWALPTLFGRAIKLPDDSEEGQKRKAVNYPVLGSDGEIMKRALIICDKYKLPVLITLHDSITFDGDVVDKIPVEELENIAPVRLPIRIKTTLRWE